MASKKVELLLVENVEGVGIVGDIVKAKPGYARNYLLPMGLTQKPTPTRIEALQEARTAALAELGSLRTAREELLGHLMDVTLTIVRSCTDQGVLYGSVSQRDIADALQENSLDVGTRSIRLNQPIRRIGTYEVPIQFDTDLRTEISVLVEPDQPLEEREDMEFDNEGNLIIKRKPRRERVEAATPPDSADATEDEPAVTPEEEPVGTPEDEASPA